VPTDPPGSVAGVLLAAGSSVRMGRNKLLLAFNGETIVRRAVRCALAVEAAVVLLADMPLVTSAMIAEVVDRYRQSGAPLVISQYGDAIAPPHLYARSLFPDLAQAEGCGKQVIRRHRAEAVVLLWPDTALTDLDVPADRDRVEALLATES
jgi:CTP:molybdopterin cytidylyltransferase MocA